MNRSVSKTSVYDNVNREEDKVGEMSVLAQFAHATHFMTHGVMGTLKENSLEPLPFTDYSLFGDKYTLKEMCINRNVCAPYGVDQKRTFLPNTPVKCVSVTAIRKEKIHFIHPYM
jgi:hypothetical protein